MVDGWGNWLAKLCYLLRSRLVMLHQAKREKKKVDFGGRVGTKNDGVAGKQNKKKGWCQEEGWDLLRAIGISPRGRENKRGKTVRN